jgi:hypothetical protein
MLGLLERPDRLDRMTRLSRNRHRNSKPLWHDAAGDAFNRESAALTPDASRWNRNAGESSL